MNIFIRFGGTSRLQQLHIGPRDQDPLSIVQLRLQDPGFAFCWEEVKLGRKSRHPTDPAKVGLPDDPNLIADLQSATGRSHPYVLTVNREL